MSTLEKAQTHGIEHRDDKELLNLASAWNAIHAELAALWEKEGPLPKKAWHALSGPLWDRLDATEEELAPLLFEWADANRLTGWDVLGFRRSDYKKIREGTGLKAHGNVIRRLIDQATYEENAKALEQWARSIPDDKWDEKMENFCTSSPEGQATKDFLLEWKAKQQTAAADLREGVA